MLKKNTSWISLVMLVGFWFLLTLSANGSDIYDKNITKVLTVDSCVTNASYTLGNPTGEYLDTVKVKFRFNSGGRKVDRIETAIKWTSPEHTYIGLDTAGYYRPWNSASWTITQQGDSVIVTIYGINPDTIFNGDSLFAVKLRLNCFTDGTSKTVRFAPPGNCPNESNKFEVIYNQNVYHIGPTLTNGSASIFGYTAEVIQDLPEYTVPIGDTAVMVIDFQTNFSAGAGYKIRGTFKASKLDFIGVDTSGTFSSGKTVNFSETADTFRIWTTSPIAKNPGPYPPLIKAKFINNATDDSIIYNPDFAVYLTNDSFFDCASANAGGNPSSPWNIAFVNTPVYKTDWSVKNMSVQEGKYDTVEVQAVNTFKVDMRTSVPDSSRAAYRVWEDSITNITIDPKNPGSHADFQEGALWYKWSEELYPPTGSRVYRSGANSNSILTHSSAYSVSGIKFTADSVSANVTDTLLFTYTIDSNSTIWFKKDSQLKGLNCNIVIRPNKPYLGDDHLALINGTITVTNQPGGGCPFVYTWDGNKFVEDNTILTQSEFSYSSTPLTDLYKLNKPLAENNGEYLLQIKEFENEETQLDEAELIAVDRPQSVKVGITPEGKILAYDKILLPVSCVDDEGKDQLGLITNRDEMLFEAKGPGYLLLTFNNPKNKEFSNYLRPVTAESTDLPCPPDVCFPKRIGVNNSMVVELEDSEGHWHTLGTLAPRANADKASLVLGSADIPLGEQFRVKISWTLDYQADWLGFYLPTEQTWYQEDLGLQSAVHSTKGDISAKMATADGNSTKLVPGESINLKFPVSSSKPEGMVRDFVFKSVGYYTRYDRASASGPFTYKLQNNYPNPFNAQTEIQYALPEPSEVNLSVYNIMGQKVRTLVEGRQSAGVYKVIWDGRNEKGETVASGVYFYTLRAGTYIETKKMTL